MTAVSEARRPSYDHEPAWRWIAGRGGRGWDDFFPGAADQGSYEGVDAFLASPDATPAGPDARALDLGCGGGQVALRLAARGYRVLAVDLSETAISLARRNVEEAGRAADIELRVGDCVGLAGVPDASADLVVDNHVLHCIVDPADRRALLAAVRRVLRPGGVLFSETMSAEGLFVASDVKADPATRIASNGTRFWARERELDAELDAAGFAVVRRWRSAPKPGEPCSGDLLATVARPHGGAA